MTLENRKRLYNHFVAEGMTAEAEDIRKKHPEIVEQVQDKPEELVKPEKSEKKHKKRR